MKKAKNKPPLLNSSDSATLPETRISLWFLFVTFFKIGFTSFGGFMALVAVVKNQLVDRKKIISNNVIIDGISLSSLLPGPTSMNVITYIGYTLRGIKGAFTCLVAVIIPSFLIMLVLSYLYFHYGNIINLNFIFFGIHPAIVAIIVAVAIDLSKKNVNDSLQIFIIVASIIIFVLFSSVITLLLVLFSSSLIGIAFYYKEKNRKPIKIRLKIISSVVKSFKIKRNILIIFLFILILLLYLIFFYPNINYLLVLRKIFLTFAGMSMSLFGGAYVFIPAMQDIIVNQMHWLTSKEFSDGIALGQITPGPVMITSTFIGYKILGISGAIVATIGIFAPPGILMIIMSKFYGVIRNSKIIISAFMGIRPAIVGLIFSASFIIAKEAEINLITILIFIASLILIVRYKFNSLTLILFSAFLGFIIKYFGII